ncbi:phosphatase PAP2 family protein [Pseudoruegeria sp. HB172150]|uniref:phosphatase PAP2 family protein n=1 Tax=Pseudoruegeria sp. HB172150 TaxID=2721164 RepID=UPI001551E3F0|nr:phosphatase PAP2 family protein [Pseudoruegeria sp. HB172150]
MSRTLKTRAAAALSLSLLATTALSAPEGVGAFTVPLPEVAYPLPVVDNYMHQTGKTADGAELNKYDRSENPIIAILSGFDEIWNLGDEAWRSGGANGSGTKEYGMAHIVDPEVWAANMAYVVKVTNERDSIQALRAYLDDRRHKGVSVLDGFGPLQALYVANSGASTSINLASDPMEVLPGKIDEAGKGPGLETSPLGDFVRFMDAMRGPEGTTSPSKYFYSSPRPWRMTDTGEVVVTGTETVRGTEINAYESNVVIVPALLNARETRGRHKDAGYPSGHTNAGYISAIAYAYAAPERFSEMLTRASELGESRILAGMHSPLDVIGGRVMATAVMAAYLNDPRFAELKAAAYDNVHDVFEAGLPEGETLIGFAQSGENDSWADDGANKAMYRFRMTYGLPQDADNAGAEMIVPKGAEVLLETRLPYLDTEQRRVVLFTTGIDSGYPVLDASNGWGRIDLVSAADGYGAFPGDVMVTMDAAKGGFHAADSWDNNISGPGMLTKAGSGSLTLSGENRFAGGVMLQEGELFAAVPAALAGGDLTIEGGTLKVSAEGVDLDELKMVSSTLIVDLSGAEEGALIEAVRAGSIDGAFDNVTDAEGNVLNATVDGGVVSVTVPAQAG